MTIISIFGENFEINGYDLKTVDTPDYVTYYIFINRVPIPNQNFCLYNTKLFLRFKFNLDTNNYIYVTRE